MSKTISQDGLLDGQKEDIQDHKDPIIVQLELNIALEEFWVTHIIEHACLLE